MSRAFVERTSAPSKTDKNFINYNYGGLSICGAEDESGYTLPNCCPYCYGRLAELDYPDNTQNHKVDWSIPADNPNTWIKTAQKNGYKTGSEPKFGAVAVFENHVACVEKIWDNGDILVSQSHYYSRVIWDTQKLTKASKYEWNGQKFVGFVYPKTEYTGTIITTSAAEDYTKNTIPNRFKVKVNGKQIGAYTIYDNAKRSADKNNGIIVDGTNGSTIYPVMEVASTTKTPNATTTIVLTANSYPDYTDGSVYRVRKSFNSGVSSAGSFSVWRNAFSRWSAVKSAGYHIYDKRGNQLD